ncbi:MAG: pyridoxal 5'-phosphate synthase lyase subunit PdxS, partial [Candidatus Eremiobacteraeota bacterium]|nr:pyridoxal 5'-phosphate synthase lyase subunit PdxS [Candidatus Eremiobacteraeota bacterium]
VARMSDLSLVRRIMDTVTIPVMAKARIGHFAEAQCLEALGVDYIDESEVLTPADDKYQIDKHRFGVPFVCGAKNLGEALRRIAEGAAMIRSKGEAGSGNIVEAVRHMRAIRDQIAELAAVPDEELVTRSRDLGAPLDLVRLVAREKKLPVVLFCAGGVSTPADAALMMQLGAEGIFVGSGIFKAAAIYKNGLPQYDDNGFPKVDPDIALKYARSIVAATTHFDDASAVVEASMALAGAKPMDGVDLRQLDEKQLLSTRGN